MHKHQSSTIDLAAQPAAGFVNRPLVAIDSDDLRTFSQHIEQGCRVAAAAKRAVYVNTVYVGNQVPNDSMPKNGCMVPRRVPQGVVRAPKPIIKINSAIFDHYIPMT